MIDTFRPTPETIAFKMKGILRTLEPGALKKEYPHGPGSRPVLVPLSHAEQEESRADLGALIDEWRKVDPKGAQEWINAGRGANPERFAGKY